MKIWNIVLICFFGWSALSMYFAYDFLLKADPEKYLGNSFFNSSSEKKKSDTIKVDDIEYLVVETRHGIGVTLKLSKNNLRTLATMVSEISDEMDSEKLNNIIQEK